MGISIAMCTYNGAPYLPQQLDSIARQMRLPDELVICDDGSTDSTVEIVEQFAQSTPFPTRVFRNAVNLGYSRNFAYASGPPFRFVGGFIPRTQEVATQAYLALTRPRSILHLFG